MYYSPPTSVVQVCVQFNSSVLVSGSADSKIRVWNYSGQCERVLEGHIGVVRCLSLAGDRLVSGGDRKRIVVWDLKVGNTHSHFKHYRDIGLYIFYVFDHFRCVLWVHIRYMLQVCASYVHSVVVQVHIFEQHRVRVLYCAITERREVAYGPQTAESSAQDVRHRDKDHHSLTRLPRHHQHHLILVATPTHTHTTGHCEFF